MSEHYEEIKWNDPKITWMKRIKGTRTLKCLRCGGTSSIIKMLHFYHGHKNCLPKPGSKEYDKMVDFMRTDLDSGMQLSKIESVTRKLLKTQGRDFDEEYEKWQKERTIYVMKIECGWCGLSMGTKPCNEEQENIISHSICKTCKIEMIKEIEAFKEVN